MQAPTKLYVKKKKKKKLGLWHLRREKRAESAARPRQIARKVLKAYQFPENK